LIWINIRGMERLHAAFPSFVRQRTEMDGSCAMAEEQTRAEAAARSTKSATGAAETGRKSIEAMTGVQKELFETFEQMNRDWFDRLKAEADLATECFSKLAGARTIPDVATAYQECATRRMQLLAEDGQRLLAAGEKFLPRLMRGGVAGPSS
jgi:hypothetical protein